MQQVIKNIIVIIIFSAYLIPLSAEPINLLIEPGHTEINEVCCCGNEIDTCCASSCSVEESHDHQASYLIGFSTIAKYQLGPLFFKSFYLTESKEIEKSDEENKFQLQIIDYNPKEKSLSGFIIPKLTSSSLIKITK